MFEEQRSPAELLPIAKLLGEEKALLIGLWSTRLKDLPIPAEPTLESRLTMRGDGLLALDLSDSTIADLTPLSGMPLGSLMLQRCEKVSDLRPLENLRLKELRLVRTSVADLTPLRGMSSLELLDLNESPVTDLSPLRGLKLTTIVLWNVSVSDLTPLAGMPLRTVMCSALPARDYSVLAGLPIERLTLHKTTIGDLGLLQGMPLTELILSGSTNARRLGVLMEIPTLKHLVLPWPLQHLPDQEIEAVAALRNHPGLKQISAELTLMGVNPRSSFTAKDEFFRDWDATVAWKGDLLGQGAKVEIFDLGTDGIRLKISGKEVHDLSGMRGLTQLNDRTIRELEISGTSVADLSPLEGMSLRKLDAVSTEISDLSPIRDLPLASLNFSGSPVVSIAPLAGSKTLKNLSAGASKVTDLAPLAGLPIETLWLNKLTLTDLSPLRGLPLKQLYLFDSDILDLSPLAGSSIERLHLGAAKVRDIAPLADCTSLQHLWMSDVNVTDIRPLAGLKLVELHLGHTRVRDLAPLRNLPLRVLTVDHCPVSDLSPLRDIPSLEELVAGKETPGMWSLRTHPQLKYLSTVWDPRNNRPSQSVSEFWARWDGKIK